MMLKIPTNQGDLTEKFKTVDFVLLEGCMLIIVQG